MIQDFKKMVGSEILICLLLHQNLGGLNMSKISSELKLSYPTVCEAIARLSESDLVSRERKGVAFIVELTDKGNEFSVYVQSAKNKYEDLI